MNFSGFICMGAGRCGPDDLHWPVVRYATIKVLTTAADIARLSQFTTT
jgi:hypothetical protein